MSANQSPPAGQPGDDDTNVTISQPGEPSDDFLELCAYAKLSVAQAKQVQAYILAQVKELIGEDEEPQFSDPYTLWGDTSYRHVDVIYGRNEAKDELRRAAQARFGAEEGHSDATS